MSSSDSKIKELSALAERLRNRSLRTEPPPDSVIEQLRKENASLKRKYQKALQLLAVYKQRLEVDLVGSTSDLHHRAHNPTVPRDPLVDIQFSSDDEDDLKENKFSKPYSSASSPSILQRYMDLQKNRTSAQAPDTRESLDLAESLNRDSGLVKIRSSNPQPPPPLPIEERIRDRN